MTAGRSAPGRRASPSAHAGPSCLQCARLEGQVTALRATLDRLIAAALPAHTGMGATPLASPPPPQETKPLPKKVARALILQFPERNRERVAHEAMARDLIAAGESESTIAQMIADGRQIDL
jgi:hypothetical protein